MKRTTAARTQTQPLAALSLAVALLGSGCASRVPGVSATEYRQWRVQEYNRGHLRPADTDQLRELERLALYTGPRCYGGEPAGSYCNRNPPTDSPRDYGSRRPVENPGPTLRGQEPAR